MALESWKFGRGADEAVWPSGNPTIFCARGNNTIDEEIHFTLAFPAAVGHKQTNVAPHFLVSTQYPPFSTIPNYFGGFEIACSPNDSDNSSLV
nr:hypothetical transcript [Hymenolepis microstoma]